MRRFARRACQQLGFLGAHPILLAILCVAIIIASVGIFGLSAWSIAVPAVILAAVIAIGVANPRSKIFYPTLVRGPRNGNRVALTFDDGPDADITPQVLDILAQTGARATFFVIGRKLAAQPELARRILAEGHELGNHSWEHSRLQNFRGSRFLQRDIKKATEAINQAGQTGKPPYRPPVGLKSPNLAHAARQLGLRTMVAWSLHSRDTHGDNPDRIARRVLKKIRPGDIILLHDGHDLAGKSRPACAEATALILTGLRERGLESVTVSDLIRCSPQTGAVRQSDSARRSGVKTYE
ncbi:MAG: polysaccharide deacetylase family protein [Gammaproteobacteria bacterium]|nr:polysaccharide deacetylase family protein [Gammaproteobacteria bacterium]